MSYPCTSCGLCCKHVGEILKSWGPAVTDPQNLLYFPYNVDDSGKCEMLGDDNKCTIYEKRPIVCNIDGLRRLLKFDKDDFYKANQSICNALMDFEKLPEELRVRLDQEGS